MKIKHLTQYLETIAPSSYQESYDNSGLIVGNPESKITGVLICLDSVEAVLDQAINKKCNLIIAHHPIVFRGLKRFNGRHYVERVVIKAIKNNLAIYAIHTNLDNVYHHGVNGKIAERLGLVNTRILSPKNTLKNLQVFVPAAKSTKLREALARAGTIPQTNHTSIGVGAYDGKEGSAEMRLEMQFPSGHQSAVLKVLHEFENTPSFHYNMAAVDNKNSAVGSGMIGELPAPVKETKFLLHIQKRMKAKCVRYTRLRNRKVRKVALCGGSGSFLLSAAIAQGADLFLTADFKYHEFFDADQQIVIADIGHYESEQFTSQLLYDLITNKFSKFAVYLTTINTNPVNYLI